MNIALVVNGIDYTLDVPPDRKLVDLVRDDLGLTGTKLACGEGACGACAVLVDGTPILSCLTLAVTVVGRSVLTVEGLARPDRMSTLQQAFLAEDALQCGYCTPGQLVSATALLERTPLPTRSEIRAALAGNLCRCGAYVKIERAVLRASGQEPA